MFVIGFALKYAILTHALVYHIVEAIKVAPIPIPNNNNQIAITLTIARSN